MSGLSTESEVGILESYNRIVVILDMETSERVGEDTCNASSTMMRMAICIVGYRKHTTIN